MEDPKELALFNLGYKRMACAVNNVKYEDWCHHLYQGTLKLLEHYI